MCRTPKALLIWRVARVPWMVIFLLGMAGGVIPGIGILFLCQRALKTSHLWALENQPS
jgi:hypothetical protein